ncbi:MAG TPA: zf-HC2 domain-containing protein [Acidimicrobiales bacterium]|nr:zf-HC2 domain-containing protein [Acidimicrobiales bacterium]
MSCDPWIEAISALADGEDPAIAPQLVRRHVATCADCRAFEHDLHATRATLRIQEAAPQPDLSSAVVKANAVADRASRWFVIRVMLGLVACQIIALSIPALLLGDQTGASPHGARHLGAFSVAYAVGLLAVVARPARARTMLPVAQVLCGAIVISTLIDVLDGSVGLRPEITHIPELVSLVLVWMLAVPPRRERVTGRGLTLARRTAGVRDKEQHYDQRAN